MQGACEKKISSFASQGREMFATFLFSTFLTHSSSTQVATTLWTCSSLVVNQCSHWRQEVDDNRSIGACLEHELANAPQ